MESWDDPQTASNGGSPSYSSESSPSDADVGKTNKNDEPQWWNFLASRTESPPLLDGEATTEWSDEMTDGYEFGFSMDL